MIFTYEFVRCVWQLFRSQIAFHTIHLHLNGIYIGIACRKFVTRINYFGGSEWEGTGWSNAQQCQSLD